jgi:hypothetical protein
LINKFKGVLAVEIRHLLKEILHNSINDIMDSTPFACLNQPFHCAPLSIVCWSNGSLELADDYTQTGIKNE